MSKPLPDRKDLLAGAIGVLRELRPALPLNGPEFDRIDRFFTAHGIERADDTGDPDLAKLVDRVIQSEGCVCARCADDDHDDAIRALCSALGLHVVEADGGSIQEVRLA